MKNEWETPELEELDVEMTMASTKDHSRLDADYPAGTPDGYIWS